MYGIETQTLAHLALSVQAGVSTIGEHQKGTPRQQVRFVFNLDYNKASEFRLGEYLSFFKERRKMSEFLRDAVRLYIDLMNGNTDVLAELFPGIVAKLQAQTTGQVGQALQDIAAAQKLMAENMAQPPGPRAMAVPQIAAPPLDDDDDVVLDIKQAEGAGEASASNFLQSAFNLVQ